MESEFTVVFLVDQTADNQGRQCVKQEQHVEGKRGNLVFKDNKTEIFDERVYGVEEHQPLNPLTPAGYVIKNRGKISEKQNKDGVQVGCIVKEYLHGGQDQAYADTESGEQDDGIQEHKKIEMEGDTLERDKQEINRDDDQKID